MIEQSLEVFVAQFGFDRFSALVGEAPGEVSALDVDTLEFLRGAPECARRLAVGAVHGPSLSVQSRRPSYPGPLPRYDPSASSTRLGRSPALPSAFRQTATGLLQPGFKLSRRSSPATTMGAIYPLRLSQWRLGGVAGMNPLRRVETRGWISTARTSRDLKQGLDAGDRIGLDGRRPGHPRKWPGRQESKQTKATIKPCKQDRNRLLRLAASLARGNRDSHE